MIHITAKPVEPNATKVHERVMAIAQELRELSDQLPKNSGGRKILLYAYGLLAKGVL